VIRIAFMVIYLAAVATAVLLLNADWGNGEAAIALLGIASLFLGLGTGRPSWALLAFLALPFAVPFGVTNEHLGGEPPYVWWFAVYWAIGSALLIVGSAVIRMVVEDRWRAAAESG
jgi:hypothetical protein